MKKIVILFFVLHSCFSYSQCLKFLMEDLAINGKEFKALVNENSGFKAWQVLAQHAPSLRTDLNELNLVSKNLEAIEKAGGYTKWKGLKGVGETKNLSKLITKYEYGEVFVFLEDGVSQVGYGFLEGKYIKLEINVKIGDEGARLAKGSDVFNELLKTIKENAVNMEIKGISGTWMDGLADNLNTFNDLILTKVNKGLMTESEAALSTFTGKMASKNGYTKVESISGPKNADGSYKYVTSVKFVK